MNLRKYVYSIIYKKHYKDFSYIDFDFWGDLKGRDLIV